MQKYRILIVEDDDFFREAICDLLMKRFHIFSAPNGKVAKEIMSIQDLDLVLTDIQMPGVTGLDLLEWSKKNKPVPFIVMTGFSMVLETKSAFELGAKGFISKPFKNVDLINSIESLLVPEAPQFSGEAKPQEFCKVSIDEFVARPRIDFDVFVKLSEDKMVKIAHSGDEIPVDKLKWYREKGLKHLYILKEEFGKLVQFNISVSKMLKDRADVSPEKKINFMKYTAEVILEKIFIQGLDKKNFKEANDFLNMTLDVLSKDRQRLDLLDMLSTHSDTIYAQALGASIYAVMIARNMGFESNSVLFKLSEAGLYHDIGKKEIDREILDKPRHLHNHEERKMVESHVVRGRDILITMNNVSDDVTRMVYEHHEDLQGLGYPMAKTKKDLHPLSPIIQLANIFMETTISDGGQKMSGIAAINHIEKIYGDRIDPKCLEALKKLFS